MAKHLAATTSDLAPPNTTATAESTRGSAMEDLVKLAEGSLAKLQEEHGQEGLEQVLDTLSEKEQIQLFNDAAYDIYRNDTPQSMHALSRY